MFVHLLLTANETQYQEDHLAQRENQAGRIKQISDKFAGQKVKHTRLKAKITSQINKSDL